MVNLMTSRFGFAVAASFGFSLACTKAPPPSPSPSANVVVDFPGTAAANRPLLLYSGRRGPDCDSFQASVANPTVTLTDVSFDPSCQVEIDAFAPGLGAWAQKIDPLVAGSETWFLNAIATGTLSITLPDLTAVPLRIWLVATPSEMTLAKGVRDDLLDKAYPILETMGTGLTLDTLSSDLNPAIVPKLCDDAPAMAGDATIYDSNRINVYFLANYGGVFDLTPAWNCWQEDHPEIVFISFENTHVPPPTLAHEVAHSLGLVHPNALGGHTNFEPGLFTPYNLMATNIDVLNISIGQLYALNFSSDSWLNRTGSTMTRPVVRTCQDIWGAGVCAALTLFKSGWPP